MFAIAALLISMSDPTATFIDDLRGCGIDEKRALVEYRDDLQDRERAVAGSEPVSDEQMDCLATAAVERGYYVEFADASLNRRFAAIKGPKMREAGRIVARAELAKRGLSATAPQFQAGQPVAVFAKRVETFCGARPGSLLKPRGNTLTLDPLSSSKPTEGNAYDRLACAVLTVTAADLESNGVSFVVTGNEAFALPRRAAAKRR